MYTWSIGSVDLSILWDMIHLINKANSYKDNPAYLHEEYSLLQKETFLKYNHLYSIAQQYDDSISSLFIPYRDAHAINIILFQVLSTAALSLASFDNLIAHLHTMDRLSISELIIRECFAYGKVLFPNDMIPYIIESKDMDTVTLLNNTDLPQNIKFSLTTLLFNFEGYIVTLIKYLTKVHYAVANLYQEHSETYKATCTVLKDFLQQNDVDKFLYKDTIETLEDDGSCSKYIFIVTLIRLLYTRVLHIDSRVLCIKGLFAIQGVLHDSDFKIF